jgi:O-antigen/teichoic acid export membrane protein
METQILFARRIGLSAITGILVTLSSVILLAILAKTLPVADFGSWSLILVTVGLVPIVASLGLQFSLVRFTAGSHDKREIQETFYSILVMGLAASLIVTLPFVLFAPQIATGLFHNDLDVALMLAANIYIASVTPFFLNYFRALQQIKSYSIFLLLQGYLNVALIAYFMVAGYGLRGAVLGLLIQQVFVLVLSACLVLRELGVVMPTFVNARTYLHFGAPLVLGDLSSWTVNASDRYLIGILLGTVAVGYYSPAYAVGSGISLLAYPFVTMLPSVLTEHYEDRSLEDVRSVLEYSLKYYCGLAIPCVFAVSILSKPLLLIIATPEIAANAYFVTPFVAAATVFVGAYEVLLQGLALKKKTALVGSVWMISAAVNIGLNLVLIPYLGIVAAALTTLVAYMTAFTLTATYSLREFKFTIRGGFVLKSVCASLVGSIVLVLWHPLGLANVLVSVSCAAAVYLGILYVLKGITGEEVRFFFSVLRQP